MKMFLFWFVALLYLYVPAKQDAPRPKVKWEGANIPMIQDGPKVIECRGFDSKYTSPTEFLDYMAQNKFRTEAIGDFFTITRNVNGQGVVTWKGETPEKDGKIQQCEFTYTFDGEVPKILQETPKKYKDYFLRSASKINDKMPAE